MADIKLAFGTATAFTLSAYTSMTAFATSATAGWKSAYVDNSGNKYLDALVTVELAAVNTAPANSKAIFLYAFGLIDGTTAYTSTGDGTPDGSEGTLTFPDVTANAIPMPRIGVIPYPTQNKAINAGPFSVAQAFGGILPVRWGIAAINHSGMVASVSAIRWIGVHETVV